MDIKKLILHKIKAGELKVSDIVKITGFSRAYVQRFFKELTEDGSIILIGKANQAKYVVAEAAKIKKSRGKITTFHRQLINKGLSEDTVLSEIKEQTGIFYNLSKNISSILDYAFTEMLNNAIEHSQSNKILINFSRQSGLIKFEVRDFGIGIFKNIMIKRRLRNKMEAIQDLLKGKQTTMPKRHTGEGIFFTSKSADTLTISSDNKKIIYNNQLDDIFLTDIKKIIGTMVMFAIRENSRKKLQTIFSRYASQAYEFAKTKVSVKLYKMDNVYISRSQARRILVGLEKFKEIIFNFKGVETIGQAFADEIYRVWQNNHQNILIKNINTNENIDLMIKRAKGK